MLIDVLDHPDAERPALPASTVLLVRDGAPGLEVLMILRSSATAFGGMWAFPGGVIEEADVPAGTAPDPMPAARWAAVREAREEVGLEIDESSLRWWSHWLPPLAAPRRFSTWFFVAPAAEGHEIVDIDGHEVHEHRWIQPAEALAARGRGEIEIVPPTYVTLDQLARHDDVASVMSRDRPEYFATRIATTASGIRVLLFDGDVGYGSGDCEAPGTRRRLTMEDSGWEWLETAP